MSTDVMIADAATVHSDSVDGPRALEISTATSNIPAVNPAAKTSGSNAMSAERPKNETATSTLRDYVELTKPRIVTMILVTTVATAMIGAGGLVAIVTMLWLLLGTAMVAGSAGAANQIWERVIDCEMLRTAKRPLPAGRVRLLPASMFAFLLGVCGTVLLAVQFGNAPAIAGVATWMLYVLVYTPMKTRTAWNTTVGAIAGALPVLIGYTATGGTMSDATGWLLVGVLVAWQYPHFMAIAWMYRRQYGEAGFVMTTTIEPTGRSAGWQSISGSLALIACGVTLAWIPGGLWMPIVATIGVIAACFPMLKASLRFSKQADDQNARKLLRSSLLVLPALLLIITIRVFW
ncbi:heme o synthase [Planctomycetes bacterium K23_9]|uniref:Protoheme IX farnesyltransferase n=1 Tax=Stieleria marina TaxID=1930275 RepID=A0A517NPG2_9BACT|nr:Protoheme IX farnesyltransferase 1 [Planctomycetes bacterium K23_9]